ncbi:MAG TPA: hypothetical protein VFF70_10850 [Anaerolineae bacterium]|nr:hypothetical protein [Anaerolineae bacterium]
MKNKLSVSRSSRKKVVPIDDAMLEQWLAEALDVPSSKLKPIDARTQAILSVVDSVRDTLVPILPSPHFVHDLRDRLVAKTSQGKQSLLQRYRTAIVIGVAAAGSVASIVGVTALLLHQKNRRSVRGV